MEGKAVTMQLPRGGHFVSWRRQGGGWPGMGEGEEKEEVWPLVAPSCTCGRRKQNGKGGLRLVRRRRKRAGGMGMEVTKERGR
ncbi:hypothetical protein OIU79_001842 [Salix purpurea]|uniref:Uncharacterized protein n=1 Tax=Salix purpurea TaxID=77065 RepID=A0A9Q0ZHI7_SALPP|nr:hypothetical protein OIU79_001842 [Salix purpurea]